MDWPSQTHNLLLVFPILMISWTESGDLDASKFLWTNFWSSLGTIFLGVSWYLSEFGEISSVLPASRALYATIKADRVAAPTTVELIAFPAKSCNSRCDSFVKRSLSKGKPWSERASRPQSGPPRVVMYGIPQGVIQPMIPNARPSISRSIP